MQNFKGECVNSNIIAPDLNKCHYCIKIDLPVLKKKWKQAFLLRLRYCAGYIAFLATVDHWVIQVEIGFHHKICATKYFHEPGPDCVWTMWYAVCKVPRARMQKQRPIPHKILYVVITMHRCAHSIFIFIKQSPPPRLSVCLLKKTSKTTKRIFMWYSICTCYYYYSSSCTI